MPHAQIFTHRVDDYAKWRETFDAHAGMREQAGIRRSRVYQDVDDSNKVTVLIEGSLDNLRSFRKSAELEKAMKAAGVIGQPDAMLVNDVT